MPLPEDALLGQEPNSESITQSHVDKLTAHIEKLRDLVQQSPDSETITQADGDALESQVQQLRVEVNAYEESVNRQKSAESQLSTLSNLLELRRWVERVLGRRWVGVLIGAVAAGAILTLLVASWKLTAASWKTTAAGALFGGCFCLIILYSPSDSRAAEESQRLKDELTTLKALNYKNAGALFRLRDDLYRDSTKLEGWRALLRGKADLLAGSEKLQRWTELLKTRQYRESQEYKRQQLLNRDWKSLRGVPFESYLEEVFLELGYAVDRTGKAGDQGVDLIVSKDGRRIAVQVKGHLDNVPNTAVQEAHTGMVFYKCEACTVITNSRFTSGGKKIASAVGCVLIDEEALPVLVMGKSDLWQLCLAAKGRPAPSTTGAVPTQHA